MAKSTLRTYIKNTADPVFARLVKMQEMDEHGRAKCVTCGKQLEVWEMDAGHYINRRHLSVRYDPWNVHVQCRKCNGFLEGEKDAYTLYLINRYGKGILEELNRKKNQKRDYDLIKLKEMVKVWRAEMDKLAVIKGNPFV